MPCLCGHKSLSIFFHYVQNLLSARRPRLDCFSLKNMSPPSQKPKEVEQSTSFVRAFVTSRGIEPRFSDWKPDVLTVRRWGQYRKILPFFLKKAKKSACSTAPPELVWNTMEEWQSGWTRCFRKAVCPKGYRGFESLLFRIHNKIAHKEQFYCGRTGFESRTEFANWWTREAGQEPPTRIQAKRRIIARWADVESLLFRQI